MNSVLIHLRRDVALIINVNTINEDGLKVRADEQVDAYPVLSELVTTGGCESIDRIKVAARVYPVRTLFAVEGTFETGVVFRCSRCLKSYHTRIADRFHVTFAHELPDSPEEPDASEIELRAEDMGLIEYSGETIDLREVVQEQVVMSFPQRTLCNESCKGLCPQCGVNRNETDCGCEQTTLNTSFAILKNLEIGDK